MRFFLSLLIAMAALRSPLAHAQVKAYEEPLVIPTWEIGSPQVHSIFPDAGDHIYPYTLNETLTDRKADRKYKAVWLENEYIKVLVLPEIGGRLHGALDKTNNYAWLYWQKTIKPGLISLTGAWISGGIEWNFPHGHRPSGFMPVDHRLIQHPDGSATVWVGETEPIYRMRWLVGMTIYPGRSYVRCDYVFINPTPHRHSFQFWATAATHANEFTQAQYPGDMVTGHGKHEFWNWPVHNGIDLTWWKNVTNASSFFAFNNPAEWFGTYDHLAQGGTVHVGNHWIVQGKKLWTWGSGPSGRIWERILTEGGGPYFEPQAGVWSDNQPDYHWMAPYEVRRAHDYWYPVRNTRGFHNASRDFALNTDLKDGKAFAGVYATSAVKGHKVVLRDTRSGLLLREAIADISPDKPFTMEATVAPGVTVHDLHLAVFDAGGRMTIDLRRQPSKKVDLPPGRKDPGDPKTMNADELFHAGEWLDRYRRTGEALDYYGETLSRDPKDSRVNTEMAFLELRKGRYDEALRRFDIALDRDSDNARIYYGKGLALTGLRKFTQAYGQFYRATYATDLISPAYLSLAKLDLRNGEWKQALEKLALAESQNPEFAEIQGYKAAAFRHLGQHAKALDAAGKALEADAMHFQGGHEKLLALKQLGGDDAGWNRVWRGYIRDSLPNLMELAAGYADAGLYADADAVLALAAEGKPDTEQNPMLNYVRGYFQEISGDALGAASIYDRARRGPAAYTNPHRLEELAALEAAIRAKPTDANAHLFLGNLLYALGRREEGFAAWRKAVQLDPKLGLAWRNIGYGERHLRKDLKASREAYQKAFTADPGDSRVMLEMDQSAEMLNVPAAERLALFEQQPVTVQARDDLILRLVDLRLERGSSADLRQALDVLRSRQFHTWEGSYGVHHAWVEANKRLGDLAFEERDYQRALSNYQQACEYPPNLEVAARTPDFRAHVYWDLARVYLATGQQVKARKYLDDIVSEDYSKPHLGTYYQALARKALGRTSEYESLMAQLEDAARERTSGRFEHRGNAAIVGRYLLALVLEEKGDRAAAESERRRALDENRHVARLAVTEAQVDTARAHQ